MEFYLYVLYEMYIHVFYLLKTKLVCIIVTDVGGLKFKTAEAQVYHIMYIQFNQYSHNGVGTT